MARGKIHLGFLSLIKILLDCCSHMWPNYFCWAKDCSSPVIHRHKSICGTIKIKLSACAQLHADAHTYSASAWIMPGYAFMQAHSCTYSQCRLPGWGIVQVKHITEMRHQACRLVKCLHVDTFIHPFVEAHTILGLGSDFFLFFFTTHSDHPNTWQRAHSLFYCKGETTLYECREHVNDCLYHHEIMFTLHSLVDAPVRNHQHATPISLSLSSSSNIPHAVSSLKNYILWHQFQFSLHWQVSSFI